MMPLGRPRRQAEKTAAKRPVAALAALAISRMKTAATWRCCPPVHNRPPPVDGSDADGSAFLPFQSTNRGLPPSQKIQHLGARGSPRGNGGKSPPSAAPTALKAPPPSYRGGYRRGKAERADIGHFRS